MKAITFLWNLALCFVPFYLSAQSPTVSSGPKPTWVSNPALNNYTPPLREIKDGYFLRQIEQQIHVDEQASYVRVVRDIVSETGVQNASEISISFDPTFEKLQFHTIKVWRNKKPLNRLQLKNFKVIADEKDLSRFLYQGTYSAYYILDDIRKGDQIEFSYTRKGRNPIFNNKFNSFIYLQEYKPVSHNYTSVLVSLDRKLHVKSFNNAPKMKMTAAGKYLKYEWVSFKQKPIEYEDNTPAWFSVCPMVQLSEFNSWNEVATWAEKINPASAHLSGAAAAFATGLRSKYKSDQEAIFREAVQFIQDEIRYMGVETGEYSHRANTPEKVFSQRYGDCKDKSLLLVTILRSLNMKADLALLSTVEKERVLNYLPSPGMFDHAVVCAYVNGKQVWVDATMQHQGGTGSTIYFPDYRKALIVNRETQGLTEIPASKKGKIASFERYKIIDASAEVELSVKTIYNNDEADYMRGSLAAKSMAESEKEYLKYYTQMYPKIRATDTIVVMDDKEKNELIILEKYSIPDFFKRDSVSGAFTAGFYSNYISNILPAISKDRKQPLYVNGSAVDHTISVVLPGGWNIDTEEKEIKKEGYRFNSSSAFINDTLSLRYSFEYLENFIPEAKTAEFASDIQTLKDDYLSYNIVYVPPTLSFYPNYILIGVSVLLILAFCVSAYFIYYKSNSPSFYNHQPIKLGGWLILIIIVLLSTFFNSLKGIIDEKYLDLNTWDFHSARKTSAFYKVFLSTKLVSEIYIACFAAFCFLLMLKKRDILPKMITVYFATAAILVTIIHILSTRLYGENSSSFNSVTYFIISSFVGIYYFRSSDRVKETFVVKARKKE